MAWRASFPKKFIGRNARTHDREHRFMRSRGPGWLAEGVGFEPTRACALPVFKTGAINRSTTPPLSSDSLVEPATTLAHRVTARQIFREARAGAAAEAQSRRLGYRVPASSALTNLTRWSVRYGFARKPCPLPRSNSGPISSAL